MKISALFSLVVFFVLSCGDLANNQSDVQNNRTKNVKNSEIQIDVQTDLEGNGKNPQNKYIEPYLTSPMEIPKSKVAVEDKPIAANTPMVGIFVYSLIKNSREAYQDEIVDAISLPSDATAEVLGDEFVSKFSLPMDMSKQALEDIVSQNDAILAITIDTKLERKLQAAKGNPFEKSGQLSDETLKAIRGLDRGAEAKRIRVGIIDSGIDVNSKEFANTFVDSKLTNILTSGNDPSDKFGHGTQMASIVGSKKLGIAEPFVEIIPLKVTDDGEISVTTLLKAIITGTNLGAEVINMSLGGESFGCTPLVGHVLYRAIEKGVFFSFSAGNGILHAPEVEIGYPLTAANDDGPLNFQRTTMPACWGKYFLGAVAVGAVTTASDPDKLKMPLFSNYGEQIELLAPGVGVPVLGLDGETKQLSGTSVSAAYVSAAAAIAIYHHKAAGFRYTPWYIENLIVQSAKTSDDLVAVERKSRFGAVLDFSRLVALLKMTEAMTHEERQEIPTINPRYLEGWKPGQESRLDRLRISSQSSLLEAGSEPKFSSIVFFGNDDQEENVTSTNNSYWAISMLQDELSYVPSSAPYFGFSDIEPGKLVLNDSKIKLLRDKLAEAQNTTVDKVKSINLEVISVFDEKQHQVVAKIPVVLTFGKNEIVSVDYKIESQPSKFRFGQTQNWFKLWANTKLSNGEVHNVDVSGSAEWRSSSPDEFSLTATPGVFSAVDAKIGATYSVFAKHDGQEISTSITLEDESIENYQIHSSLGSDGAITIGQQLKLTSQVVLASRKQPVKSDWYLGTHLLASGVSELLIDTSKIDEGTLKAAGMVIGDNVIVSKATVSSSPSGALYAEHILKLTHEVDRIEVVLVDPVVREGGELLLNLKVFYDNNSNEIITSNSGVTWSVSHPELVNIQSSGKATVKENSAFTRITISGSYKGKTSSEKSFIIVSGNPVTGSSSDLIDLEILPQTYGNRFFCTPPPMRRVNAIYKDGVSRDITGIASASYHLLKDGVKVDNPQPSDYSGGDILVVDVVYNDGSGGVGGGGTVHKSIQVPIPSTELDAIRWNRAAGLVFSTGQKWNNSWRAKLFNTSCHLEVETNIDAPFFDSSSLYFIKGDYTLDVTWQSNASGSTKEFSVALPFSVIKDSLDVIVPDASTFNSTIAVVDGKTIAASDMGTIPFYPERVNVTSMFQLFASDDVTQLQKFRSYTATADEVLLGSAMHNQKLLAGEQTRRQINGGTNEFLRTCVDSSIGGTLSVLMSDAEKKIIGEIKYSVQQSPNIDQEVSIQKEIADLVIPLREPSDNYCTAQNRSERPFAGGSGADSDPFRICTVEQFVSGLTATYIGGGNSGYNIALEDDLDFENNPVSIPVASTYFELFDGKDHQIKNFVLIDAERDYMGLLPRVNRVKNLFIKDVTIKGRNYVGAVCGSCNFIDRVYVEDSSITGDSFVGGLSGVSASIFDSGLMASFVYSRNGTSGGLAGSSQSIFRSFVKGEVIHIGVPGLGGNIGGLVGKSHVVLNSRFSGTVIGSQSVQSSHFQGVGGIAGFIESVAIYNAADGLIVNAGSDVGGIVGAFADPTSGASQRAGKPFGRAFDLNLTTTSWMKIVSMSYGSSTNNAADQRSQALIGNEFSGTVIGGRSREQLYCLEGMKEVLGTHGSLSCDGDENNISSPTTSATGGAVGFAVGLYARDNRVEGKVRSINGSGGLFGHLKGFAPLINNTVNAQVSVSETSGANGSMVGTLQSYSCDGVLNLNTTGAFVKSNVVNNEQDSVYHVGKYLTIGGPILNQSFP